MVVGEDVRSKWDSSSEGGGLMVLFSECCVEVSTNDASYRGKVRKGIPEGSLCLVVCWGIDIMYVDL